jgi:hypothetical protein
VNYPLNRVFGLPMLLYLLSKLINASIGCHGFIVDLMKHISIPVIPAVYWFFTNGDSLGIFVLFQSADCVQGKVNKLIYLIIYGLYRYLIKHNQLTNVWCVVCCFFLWLGFEKFGKRDEV